MGCTSTKYQALSADQAQAGRAGDSATGKPASSGADAVPITPDSQAAQPTTPSMGNTPGSPSSADAAVGAPPWLAGTRDQSVVPGFDPPLAESAGDSDVFDMDLVSSENLEEQFPPWKESDKIRPTSGFDKFDQVQKTSAQTLTNADAVFSAPEQPEVLELVTSFENTVIIFDWDDTLLCSSALHCCLPSQFLELEETVESVLQLSMSLGRTILVTNAMESWVQETARRFLPRLVPLLERLPIVYARKNWERHWPRDTFAWKRECFREVLHDELGSDLNLLVIGDSFSEIRAAEALQEYLGLSALVKTVKFKAMPSPTDLLGELRMILPELSRLVEESHCSSRELFQDIQPGMFQAGGSLFHGAPGWQLLDAVPAEMFSPPPGVFAHQHLWSIMPSAAATQISV